MHNYIIKTSSYCFVSGGFFGLNRNRKVIITPAINPASADRNMTIAREASNFQKKNVNSTGFAFSTENTATRTMMIKIIAILSILCLFPVYSFLSGFSQESAHFMPEKVNLVQSSRQVSIYFRPCLLE